MSELIEAAVCLQDIAKTMKNPVAQVEADCHELSLFLGCNWAGRPALSVVDAHGLVSGATRRAQDADRAWRAHLASTEEWETERERRRAGAFQEAYDAALRQGRGAPAAAAAGHEAARVAVHDFERRTPPPEFNDAAPSRLSKMKNRAKEVVVR